MNFKGLTALAFLCLAACAGWASGGELAAVITKRSGAYLEAFSAFQAAYGEEIASYDLASGKPDIAPGTRTVVAFGGKAASQDYPAGFNIIYCMAPGLVLGGEGREGKVVEVSMLPAAGTVLDSIKAIQPSVQRLAVFWMTPDFGAFGEKLKAEGALRGIIISPVRVKEYKELPGLLRGLKGSADAFWLAPDPLMITSENIMLMREFSWNNGIPFYGSTKGLTREGATASVGVAFKDFGISAAGAAAALREGKTPPRLLFPDKPELTLNLTAAKKCGVIFSQQILGRADFMFP